ncbi:sigma-54-dependent transcriptional regulator [Desulfatitalea alkaliphila]|uniref:Sigma-54 dependent transcriptional regulator n=1 Tax=Desulfatitalea alkaliphila TaxID=2929485 RepID=A0AA41UK18_9BACT|nr:sigma-54 dependent transcriptional regulator [Desulfatitalea alkaliphila]MCJ8501012.1 sigma-54 dependent transcriptional regulator [Desulfatitalea alkaliphila]
MQEFPILFVDDDQQILDVVATYLDRNGYRVDAAGNGKAALEKIKQRDYAAVFTDLIMPDISGLDLLKSIKSISPATEVIIVTGYGTIESAIEALKLGSYDYLQKPINFERLKLLIDRIAEKRKLQLENVLIKRRLKDRYNYDQLVGKSGKMQQIYEVIDRISSGSPTVLIQGESGTGKELVANVIHQNSVRRDKPFIPVNCGAISEGLLESELFGHVKGAFTGAIKDNIGLFKAADGGTIFLDEIAEVPPSLQVKLLRALQERKIRPVGDTRESDVDVRVIAATNKNLEEEIRKKTFREDLYYRLNVIFIQMPPLREIKDDIPHLVHHFMAKFSRDSHRVVERISPEALDLLLDYDWPGNVRQLENVIERAFALGMGDTIQVVDLPPEVRKTGGSNNIGNQTLNLSENEKLLIGRALKQTNGNKAEAAKLLGINLTTVYRKMEKYKMNHQSR